MWRRILPGSDSMDRALDWFMGDPETYGGESNHELSPYMGALRAAWPVQFLPCGDTPRMLVSFAFPRAYSINSGYRYVGPPYLDLVSPEPGKVMSAFALPPDAYGKHSGSFEDHVRPVLSGWMEHLERHGVTPGFSIGEYIMRRLLINVGDGFPTIADVARYLYVSRSTASRWLSGDVVPSLRQLYRIMNTWGFGGELLEMGAQDQKTLDAVHLNTFTNTHPQQRLVPWR